MSEPDRRGAGSEGLDRFPVGRRAAHRPAPVADDGMSRAAGHGTRAGLATLAPLFLVSLAAVGFEIALARYFAVAQWSEYGYWVISIAMVGFALSGATMALGRDGFVRHGEFLRAVLPPLLVVAAAVGFHFVVTNPFNPLQLQNAATWVTQIWNIAGYYAALFPFFFLTGLYISLCFVLNSAEVGRVYGWDLLGAGAGSVTALGLMAVLNPFYLLPALLVPLALAALFVAPSWPRRWRIGVPVATLLALVAGEAVLLLGPGGHFNDFKAIFAPMNTPDARILAERRLPRGHYLLLDDFLERVDTDISNNAGMLGLPGPPASFGLYRDGNRIASLPKPGEFDVGYAPSALDALPYALRPGASVLMAGGSGGFRPMAALSLGAGAVRVLEPEPVLRDALLNGLATSPALPADERLRVSGESPLAAMLAGTRYGLIDISADFLDAGEVNATAFTAEAVKAAMGALEPGGILSIPVSIREFPVYAARVLATVRAGLLAAGIADPPSHVLAYRSAWSVRILASNRPWSAEDVAAMRRWAAERSFDISHHPGLDVAAERAHLFNDLPAMSFDTGQVASDGPRDALADEAAAILAGQPTATGEAFSLDPVTLDRPPFFAALYLSRAATLLERLEVLPQQEIGALINLAVLAQAFVIAGLVLLVPLLGGARLRGGAGVARPILYFAALGLGFLMIEIVAIERASLLLNDRTAGFALVLTGMLVFSGLGSMLAGGQEAAPGRALALCTAVVIAWGAALAFLAEPLLLRAMDLPWAVRATIVLVAVAPVSVALGMFFPLGLARVATLSGSFLPWAWGLNGAFSVVATPLANLMARELGLEAIVLTALLLYATAYLSFPAERVRRHAAAILQPDTP
ncbi:hypothetical protein [Muricoccus radiodurans]|uniref:hypothetical protein n=1 Tax=Muricoccus radiodurans TaxID=2231721 RepID=UPI003CE96161